MRLTISAAKTSGCCRTAEAQEFCGDSSEDILGAVLRKPGNCLTTPETAAILADLKRRRFMRSKEELKAAVCAAIDQQSEQIIGLGEAIMDQPELGFKEEQTARRVCESFADLGLRYERELALTGVKARLKGQQSGPTVALMGELDALIVPDHPRADPTTGAAHACGHNAQIAGMVGAAYGLVAAGVSEELAGEIRVFRRARRRIRRNRLSLRTGRRRQDRVSRGQARTGRIGSL